MERPACQLTRMQSRARRMWGASTRARKGGPGTVNRCLLGALLVVLVATFKRGVRQTSPTHTMTAIDAHAEGTLWTWVSLTQCQLKLKAPCKMAWSRSSHLSGRKLSTSVPHTSMSRWMEYVGTLSTVPAGKVLPRTVSPSSGTTRGSPKPEGEKRRRLSLMTASR